MSFNFYLITFTILLLIGLIGIILNRGNILRMIFAIQIAMIACLSFFIVYDVGYNDIHGQMFSIFYLLFALVEFIIAIIIVNNIVGNKN